MFPWLCPGVVKVVVALPVLLYAVLPLLLRLFPRLALEIIFLHHVKWRPFVSLDQPRKFGLKFTRSFKLKTEEDVNVGIWQILPLELQKQEDEVNEEHLSYGPPVILYLHGTAGNRGVPHRVKLYKILANCGYHVITLDYRGYGDSTGQPSEDGVCRDAFAVYKWILKRSGKAPVYLWGHSLGSGVATKVSKWICEAGLHLDGLVLEAPFNNLVEASRNHHFSLPFRWLPWFTWSFIEALNRNKLSFSSENSIKDVTVPILILNSKHDRTIPYRLGIKLYDAARCHNPDCAVQIVTFEVSRGIGHDYTHLAPELPTIVGNFMAGRPVSSES